MSNGLYVLTYNCKLCKDVIFTRKDALNIIDKVNTIFDFNRHKNIIRFNISIILTKIISNEEVNKSHLDSQLLNDIYYDADLFISANSIYNYLKATSYSKNAYDIIYDDIKNDMKRYKDQSKTFKILDFRSLSYRSIEDILDHIKYTDGGVWKDINHNFCGYEFIKLKTKDSDSIINDIANKVTYNQIFYI